MIINYKIVDDRYAKGIIVTSETIMDLRSWMNSVSGSDEAKEGAKAVIDFLENSYRKSFR